jgi:methylated-DNA-protein-cysteine methyltransferase-like protein
MHTYPRIWSVVERIPRGRVATYGDIARRSRCEGQARLVGYALHNLPPGSDVPWHRVVNARGQVSLPGASGQKQRRLLEREGVKFHNGRINLEKYRW